MAIPLRANHRHADSKRRVTLGGHFANRTVIVDYVSNDEVVVRLARVIPEREAWLYENPQALAAVRRGLDQSSQGQCHEELAESKGGSKAC